MFDLQWSAPFTSVSARDAFTDTKKPSENPDHAQEDSKLKTHSNEMVFFTCFWGIFLMKKKMLSAKGIHQQDLSHCWHSIGR